MAIRNVVQVGDEVLRTKCFPVETFDESLHNLLNDMKDTLEKEDGAGLAAPQVGVLKRIIVIDCDQEDGRQDPITLINPEILELKGELVTEEEGCLSCPGISVPECRREYAVVKFTDFDGEDYIIEGDGLLGRCLQHEIDHLNGKTLFESAAPAARLKALRDYEIARAAGAKPGDTSID